jgi:signal transduction histidine kinase
LPRINDKKDSQFLANQFGRPFARVIAIPLDIHRTGGDFERITPGVLYFEHSLDDSQRAEFIDFVHERLHPLGTALDRIFLEKDLLEASLVWEKTFDGISDPIAIFDRDQKLLRANRVFHSNLGELPQEELFAEQIKIRDRSYAAHVYPIVGGRDDTPSNLVIHYVDVTMAQQMQKQMVQQEKMAALGHLAGNIAHELNNPLTGIRSLAQVLISQIPKEDRRHEDLMEVESAAERCQIIIKNLLDFSSGQVRSEWVSMNDLIVRTLPFLKTLIRNYEVNKNFSNEDTKVYVEPQLLQQVVFNLVKNACQAMGENGILSLETNSVKVGDQIFCELIVGDTGPGMPKEVIDHIFDFFFTTKSAGQGTGLGLSLCKSIVERYDGTIQVDSQVGVGSRFIVRIPKRADT